MNISFIIPSYNNLRHLKNVYNSIKIHAPLSEIILLDDGSTDDTWEWIQNTNCIKYRSPSRVGHTILYDKGIELATNEIVGILHADMIIGPNYIENLIKHIKPKTVVCATRIEPPLHPSGKEKIIKDFGLDFDTLNVTEFENFCIEEQVKNNGETTKGMFAPWIIYKSDFQAIGGHDALFAPFPYEDSDIFQRWVLAGYKLVQSRDSFVYHLTCRGHRWTETVGKDDDFFKIQTLKAGKNYLRKWGSWIKNDEYQHPVISHKYNIGFVVKNCNNNLLEILEPWCDNIYIEDKNIIENYIKKEQPNTKYNLHDRVGEINNLANNNVVLEFDGNLFGQEQFNFIQNLSEIISSSAEVGIMEYDIFKFTINSLDTYENNLIVCKKLYELYNE